MNCGNQSCILVQHKLNLNTSADSFAKVIYMALNLPLEQKYSPLWSACLIVRQDMDNHAQPWKKFEGMEQVSNVWYRGVKGHNKFKITN